MPLDMMQSKLGKEYERLKRWILESRRSADTWLISRGYMLKPPFNVEGKVENNILNVAVTGVNDTLTFKCNRVVDSPFRDQLGLFLYDMNSAVSEFKVIAPFTRHLQLILQAFPPNSRFKSEELYTKVTWAGDSKRTQAHARRRWKELKYDYGFDLDWDGKMYWRGPDLVPVREPALRPDDKRIRKKYWAYLARESLKKYNDILPHCEYCDAKVISRDEEGLGIDFDSIGLIDHRRPVFQGGDDSRENLQILCQTCNNIKNSSCRKCPYGFRCDDCVWAYPDKLKSRRLVIHLSPESRNMLLKSKKNSDLQSIVVEIIEQATNRQDLERS